MHYVQQGWTVRGEALSSILNNFTELMFLWEWSLEVLKDTEMKARVRGVQTIMPAFNFIFGCSIGESLLRQVDNLSRALQDASISAAEGYAIAQDVIKTLSKDRNDESFSLFWERLIKLKEEIGANEPKLPRKRKRPVRLDESESRQTYHFCDTPKERYRLMSFEAYDQVVQTIKQRFDQPDFLKYIHLQNLLLNSAKGKDWATELQQLATV